MPTRVVGTCCCGLPSFEKFGRMWVRIDVTCGDQYYQDYVRRVITSFTVTYMSQVPPKWRRSNTYSDGTYTTWPVSTWTDSSAGMPDWERTSFLAISLGELNGGPDGDSLDPDDWVALITDLSAAPISIVDFTGNTNNNPVGHEINNIRNTGPEMRHLVWSNEWTLPFSYKSTAYQITFAQNGTALRDRFIPLSFTYDANDEVTSASWYARYEFDDINFAFSRVQAQNGGGDD